jgi:hypothetical protein
MAAAGPSSAVASPAALQQEPAPKLHEAEDDRVVPLVRAASLRGQAMHIWGGGGLAPPPLHRPPTGHVPPLSRRRSSSGPGRLAPWLSTSSGPCETLQSGCRCAAPAARVHSPASPRPALPDAPRPCSCSVPKDGDRTSLFTVKRCAPCQAREGAPDCSSGQPRSLQQRPAAPPPRPWHALPPRCAGGRRRRRISRGTVPRSTRPTTAPGHQCASSARPSATWPSPTRVGGRVGGKPEGRKIGSTKE